MRSRHSVTAPSRVAEAHPTLHRHQQAVGRDGRRLRIAGRGVGEDLEAETAGIAVRLDDPEGPGRLRIRNSGAPRCGRVRGRRGPRWPPRSRVRERVSRFATAPWPIDAFNCSNQTARSGRSSTVPPRSAACSASRPLLMPCSAHAVSRRGSMTTEMRSRGRTTSASRLCAPCACRASGAVHAWKDYCIHRGARLSLGHVEAGNIVCPDHGWCYNVRVECVKIPTLPGQTPPLTRAASSIAARSASAWCG
jgi:nitrite reductase/ring-hydroxylating ferredoxin subunit